MDELALFDRILGGAIVLRSGEGLPGFEMFYVLNPAIESPGDGMQVEALTKIVDGGGITTQLMLHQAIDLGEDALERVGTSPGITE